MAVLIQHQGIQAKDPMGGFGGELTRAPPECKQA
jgi:hypothetical protein